MDSPVISRLFKQLFSHRYCETARLTPRFGPSNGRRLEQRHVSRRTGTDVRERNWQQRTEGFSEERTEEFQKYPLVTFEQLKERRERPRRVKMLMRDFIEDSLYNPSYGYFSNQVVIFHPGEPFRFGTLRDESEFNLELGRRYTDFEDALDERHYNPTRQLWHTPTELFRPYYGEAMARYMVSNYKLSLYPYHDLIIYELGAGNGTLMLNILDHIRETDPAVYARTKFKIIEISSSLAEMQTSTLRRTASSKGHFDKVEIINRSIFDWDTYVASPCFFLALEVFDNFAHDCIRYDPMTEDPLQAQVLIDSDGEFFEFYSLHLDPLASRYLRVRDAATSVPFPHPLRSTSSWLRKIRANLPLARNLTLPEFIPSKLLQFFDILRTHFPNHRLVTSDFHQLPETIQGLNAPVVQTRYERRTVAVTTPLVHQGYFDILFPTSFPVMEEIYRAVTGKLTKVSTHEEFLRGWADVECTRTRSGENPMLSWYRNANVMTTV